jgi:hypothetical protein
MPTTTEWIDPELFFTTSAGVNVFHTYKDDDVDQGRRCYWYTLYSNTDGHSFDVRDFDDDKLLDRHPPYMQGKHNTPENKAAWDRWHQEGEPAAIRQIITAALDAGRIPLPEDMTDNIHEPTGG